MLVALLFASLVSQTCAIPSSSSYLSSSSYSSSSNSQPSSSSSSSSSFATTPQPSASSRPHKANPSNPVHFAADTTGNKDLDTLYTRRRSIIVGATTDGDNVRTWSKSIGNDGKWKDVDYQAGCDAQTAEWPAYFHWRRLLSMATVYAGPVSGDKSQFNSAPLLKSINLGLNFWFKNDFNKTECAYAGGTPDCPCGTPGLWNKNWFSSIILVPKLVAKTCIVLNDTLTSDQRATCKTVTSRAYNAFNIDIPGVKALTGANLLDVASIGIDYGILFQDQDTLKDAYQRIHSEVSHVKQGNQDGIHSDGSFTQHGGQLYNGNYGKDYLNDLLAVEVPAAGTQFQAGPNTMKAIASLVSADAWMFVYNTITDVLHWDVAVIGRFIAYPVSAGFASAETHVNLTLVDLLGKAWNFADITDPIEGVQRVPANANAGNVKGIRNFPNGDYLVSRGPGYVTSLKMYSSRTHGWECLNGENLKGFHLADGSLRTYINGNEYEDIAASMDWNLIPGITVDYGATPFDCRNGAPGIESFVGSAVAANFAASAMRYTNPDTKQFSFQKGWFFLENDVQYVLVSSISSKSTAPVYNVLDQRRRFGDIHVNDKTQNAGGDFQSVKSLWHGGVGYSLDGSPKLTVKQGMVKGDWGDIAQSDAKPSNVDMFTAYIDAGASPVSYSIFPGTTSDHQFKSKLASTQITVLQNDVHVSAIFDVKNQVVQAIFWDDKGGTLSVPNPSDGVAPFQIAADDASIVIYKIATNTLTVADPTQQLQNVGIKFTATGDGKTPWGSAGSGVITANFPSGDGAGGSVASRVSVHPDQPTTTPSASGGNSSGDAISRLHLSSSLAVVAVIGCLTVLAL